jgi:hypothetical protein
MNRTEKDDSDKAENGDSVGMIRQIRIPKEITTGHHGQTRENKQVAKGSDSLMSSLKNQVLEGVGFIIAIIVTFGIAALLLRGCLYVAGSRDSNDGGGEDCAYAGERVDQVKRLRDSGFVSESAVRRMKRVQNEACQ